MPGACAGREKKKKKKMMMMKLLTIAAVLSIAGAYPTKDDIVGEIQKVKGLSTEEKLEALVDKRELLESLQEKVKESALTGDVGEDGVTEKVRGLSL